MLFLYSSNPPPHVETKKWVLSEGSVTVLIASEIADEEIFVQVLSSYMDICRGLQRLFHAASIPPPQIIVLPSFDEIFIASFESGPGSVSAENPETLLSMISPALLSAIHKLFPSLTVCAIAGLPHSSVEMVLFRVPSIL